MSMEDDFASPTTEPAGFQSLSTPKARYWRMLGGGDAQHGGERGQRAEAEAGV